MRDVFFLFLLLLIFFFFWDGAFRISISVRLRDGFSSAIYTARLEFLGQTEPLTVCRYLFRVRERLKTEDQLLEERRIQEIVGHLCHIFI